MFENRVKRTLQQGGWAAGVMCMEFATAGIAAASAAAGVDFVLYDMEHTGWGLETIKMLVGSSIDQQIVPLVRVPTTEYHWIAHSLDVGAMGIVIPLCRDAAQAKLAVQYAKYPPMGRRGCAFGISHDRYRGGDVKQKIDFINQNTMLIMQIENLEGLDNVEEIAAVEGVDGLWVGQFDLSASMGIPGQFDHPDIRNAVDRVLAVASKHGKFVTLGASDPAELAAGRSKGFRLLVYVADIWIYQQAVKSCMQSINS